MLARAHARSKNRSRRQAQSIVAPVPQVARRASRGQDALTRPRAGEPTRLARASGNQKSWLPMLRQARSPRAAASIFHWLDEAGEATTKCKRPKIEIHGRVRANAHLLVAMATSERRASRKRMPSFGAAPIRQPDYQLQKPGLIQGGRINPALAPVVGQVYQPVARVALGAVGPLLGHQECR